MLLKEDKDLKATDKEVVMSEDTTTTEMVKDHSEEGSEDLLEDIVMKEKTEENQDRTDNSEEPDNLEKEENQEKDSNKEEESNKEEQKPLRLLITDNSDQTDMMIKTIKEVKEEQEALIKEVVTMTDTKDQAIMMMIVHSTEEEGSQREKTEDQEAHKERDTMVKVINDKKSFITILTVFN